MFLKIFKNSSFYLVKLKQYSDLTFLHLYQLLLIINLDFVLLELNIYQTFLFCILKKQNLNL